MRISSIYKIKNGLGKFVAYTILIFVALACIFPLFWMFGSALKTQSTVFSDFSLFPKHMHWENFTIAWTKAHFGMYFFNSVLYTVITVGGLVFFSTMAAFAFSRLDFPFKNALFLMFVCMMMIPLPGQFVALYVLLTKLHLVNTRIGYILPQIDAGQALAIFILKTFFDNIPRDLEDSARIDGCNKWGIYWHLAFPLAKPAIAVVIIFNCLAVWNEYLLAMLVFSDKSLMPLPRGLMVFQGTHMTEYALLMAGVSITVIPIILVYLVMQKYIISGITAGALKG
ncbi:MAG: carbohydrate ABC transporter permease [Candidatus Omnitrophota bacterium]|nr:MAG: carbohydrate ABC transporter permease [Candidatus Omnitrophota bacterium]